MTDSNSSETTDLLQALHRDWSDKRSIQECLRSKAVPAVEVRHAMTRSSPLTPQIGASHQILLSSAATTTLRERITRQAVCFRFLQYLLETQQPSEQILQCWNDLVSSTAKTSVKAFGSATEADQVFKEELEEPDSSMGETENAMHRKEQKAALFHLGSMLQMNHYVSRQPFLLLPLWKAMSAAVQRLQFIPVSILQNTVRATLQHLEDGLQQLNEQQQNRGNNRDFLLKILGFFIARMTILLRVGPMEDERLSKQLLRSFMTLRSLSTEMSALTNKVEKCWSAWWDCDADTIVTMLLTETDDGEAHIRGRIDCYLDALESKRALETEQILSLIWDVVFGFACQEDIFPPSLYVRLIRSVVQRLLQCCCQPEAQSGSMHYLILHWMEQSETHHPATREIWGAIVFGVAAQLPTFLDLMIQLLMDRRTSIPLQIAISTCLGRLRQAPASRDAVQSRLRQVRDSVFSSSRKRKRTQDRGPGWSPWIVRLFGDLTEESDEAHHANGSSIRTQLLQATYRQDPSRLIELFLKICRRGHQDKIPKDLARLVLRLLPHAPRENQTLSQAIRVLESCDSILADRALPLDKIRVLGALGATLTETITSKELKYVTQTFRKYLSDGQWSIHAYSMTSFVKLASSVSSQHSQVLPECVPPKRKRLLKQRLRGLLPKENIAEHRARASRQRTRHLPRPDRFLAEAPSVTDLLVGSFVMSMPTQEGRTALVIFPKGPQSVSDIEYLMNGDDSVAIQKLEGSITTPEGACQLLLRPKE